MSNYHLLLTFNELKCKISLLSNLSDVSEVVQLKKYTLSILLAGTLWGLMGLFVRTLGKMGISSTEAVGLRFGTAAVLYALVMLARHRDCFHIRLRDVWCFLGAGLCSLLFFTYCYFSAMECIGLSLAAVLLYTAPAFVIVISRIVFGEKLGAKKICAVLLAFVGCFFVSGGGGEGAASVRGLTLGLGAGFGYALYSIFARLAMNRGYSSLSINFYSCLIAAAGSALVWNPASSLKIMFSSPACLGFCILTALVTCFAPYLLYTYGLSGTDTGKASVMASVEPVVATMVGALVYKERLTLSGVAGMVLVLSAVVLLNLHLDARVENT